MKVAVIAAFLACGLSIVPCAAQQPPAIRGHHVGETVMEFLATENAAQKLTECHDLLANPKTPKRSQKDILVNLNVESCMKVADVIRTGAGEIGAGQLNMAVPGHAMFEQGKLVKMELDFWNLPPYSAPYRFDSIVQDFSAKFGSPSQTWADEFQNGFGARFSYRRAAWKTKDLLIYLSQLQDDSATAVIEDRAHAEKSARESEAQHKNALDR